MPKSIYIPKKRSDKNQVKEELDFSKVLADIKQFTEGDESANQEQHAENQHLVEVLAKIDNLAGGNLGKNDVANIFQIFGRNFESCLKTNSTLEQLKIIKNELENLINNKTIDDKNLEEQVDNLYALLGSFTGQHTIGEEKIDKKVEKPTIVIDMNSILDLDDYEKDVKGIKVSIEKYKGILENKDQYTDLLNSLNMIENILGNPKYKNLIKLQKFLNIAGDCTIPEFDGNDVNPVINGVEIFLENLEGNISAVDTGGQVVKNYEAIIGWRSQENTKIKGSFHKFSDKLTTDKISTLTDLTEDDIDDILEFIGNEENKDNVLDAHLTMLKFKNTMMNGQISDIFDKINGQIETIYEQEERGQRELDEKAFTNIDKFFKSRISDNDSWDGQNLEKNDPEIKEKCEGHEYNVEQFVNRFNIANDERIEKNKDVLKNITITDKISEITMKKIKLDGENLIFTKSESIAPEELTQSNFAEKLGIKKETIGYIKGIVLAGSELDTLIKDPDIQKVWLEQIIAKVRIMENTKVTKMGIQPKESPTNSQGTTFNKEEAHEATNTQSDVNNIREDLNKYISDKEFPGKTVIQNMIDEEDENQKVKNLKLIQLQIVPYYDGHIDGLLDQETLTGIESYIEKNLNNKGINIVKSSDPSVIRCDSNGNITNNTNELNIVIKEIGDNNLGHIYFLDYQDFEYSIENDGKMRATVKDYNYVYDIQNDKLQRQKGDDPEQDVTNEKVLQGYFKTIIKVTK